ncbi:MAG: LL-diaminopimelate aminotransferase [Parachlamydiales bacterium]|nr:LL-diaminopimelate aminotransferase [Parachlamydiales bacterium]
MVARNSHLEKLKGTYLFSQIDSYKKKLLDKDPSIQLISLGTGDTSEPITPHITQAMVTECQRLGTLEGYRGYGPDFGLPQLRKKISDVHYKGLVDPEDIYVSDGAGCDIARWQMLFGAQHTLAVQDPSYPAYVDNGVIMGQTGTFDADKKIYKKIVPLAMRPDNNFFCDLSTIEKTDIIALCSPNNPTGTTLNREQFQQLVDFAKSNQSIILYDAVYTPFIRDKSIPQSIYEIPGAKEVAIECHSFSKSAGFTGVRLGWSVVPKELKYDDGTPVYPDWQRISTTSFNGASLISQAGGLAALDEKGLQETKAQVDHYLMNAKILRDTLSGLGFTIYGGENAPYLWLHFPKADYPGLTSWDIFEDILNRSHVVTIPGSGFGPAGENFIRLSAFGHRQKILDAAKRLKNWAETSPLNLQATASK